jgi:FO synthase
MDESITRSAGASHGQEMTPVQMEAVIRSLARTPRQRNTLYATVPEDRYRASFAANPSFGRGHASATEQGTASTT